MARRRRLEIEITDSRKGTGFRDASRDVDTFGAKITKGSTSWGRSLSSFAKTASIGLGVVGVGAVALGVDFVRAAEDGIAATRQTEAVIKSMGGAANVTADDVVALSESLAMKAGIDDEIIQSGQNVLMTFGNIRNEVGKGNDVFDRATVAALDMSVAMGQDMQASVVQLGKALNDPIAGITSLTRVGVQFTDQQKDQIAALVAAGDTMGAQQIILAELERQFGGSAEAQATATGKMTAAWEILKGELGERILPLFNAFSDWVITSGLPALESFATNVSETLSPALSALGTWIQETLIPALGNIWTWLQVNVIPVLQDLAVNVTETVIPALSNLWTWITESLVPALQRLWRIVADDIIPRYRDIARVWVEEVGPAVDGLVTALGELFGAGDKSAGTASDNTRAWSFLADVLAGATFGPRLMATAIGGIADALAAVTRWADTAFRALDRLKSAVPGGGVASSILGLGGGISTLRNLFGSQGGMVTTTGIEYLAAGGWPRSRGTDTVPAMLTPGEMVLTAADQRELLGGIRSGRLGRAAGPQKVEVTLRIVGSGGLAEAVHQGVRKGEIQLQVDGQRVAV